jgi:hypothetical protein
MDMIYHSMTFIHLFYVKNSKYLLQSNENLFFYLKSKLGVKKIVLIVYLWITKLRT